MMFSCINLLTIKVGSLRGELLVECQGLEWRLLHYLQRRCFSFSVEGMEEDKVDVFVLVVLFM
jgi:hypothetical protein